MRRCLICKDFMIKGQNFVRVVRYKWKDIEEAMKTDSKVKGEELGLAHEGCFQDVQKRAEE